MNGAQHYTSKGKSAEIFHEGKTFQKHTFSFKTFTLLPLPSLGYPRHYGHQLQGTTERTVFLSTLWWETQNVTSSWNFPGLPDKDILTQLSTAVLMVIYIKYLLTCLTWYQPPSCEAGTTPCSVLPHPKVVPSMQQIHNILCASL